MPTPGAAISTGVPTDRRFVRTALGILLIAFAAIAFGWPTRNGGYITGDDERLALHHVFVNHPSWQNAARLLTIVHGDLYQPLPVLSFELNYALAEKTPTQRSPVCLLGFHWTNILLHAGCSVLVFLLASRLTACRSIGLLTALLFACHPFAVEPVAWISGRTILLASFFSLLLLLELPFGRCRWIAPFTWLFALASKVLPTVPLAAMCCDWHLHAAIPRRRWPVYGLLLLMSAVATVMVYHATQQAGFIDAMEAEPADSLPVRMLLAARYYLENYVWPSRLSGWSPPPLGFGLISPAVGIAAAELIALAWLAATMWRRHRNIGLGLVLFLILLAPFLAASVARRFLAADRYMYLPILGLHLAVASMFVALFDLFRRRLSRTTALLIVGAPVASILIAWFTVGWRLGPTWADNVKRCRRSLAVNPDNVLAYVELARAFVIENQPDAALATVEKARRRWPNQPRLAGVAGEAYRLKEDWPAAEKELRLAVAGLPQHIRTRYFLARTLEQQGKVDEARAAYRRIFTDVPTYYPAIVALARSYEKHGDISAAIDAFQKAIAINPYDSDALLSLAVLYIRQEKWASAEPLLRSILELEPNDTSALLNLGVVLTRTNRHADAIEIYDRLIANDPENAYARLNRASLLSSLGRVAEAETDYRTILAKQHEWMDAAIALHELLQKQRRFRELPAIWLGMTASDNDKNIRGWLVWAYVLAGDIDSAGTVAHSIPAGMPGRAFSDWAMAFDALRGRRLDEFRQRVLAIAPPRPISDDIIQQARIIRLALLDLPAKTRESAAGLFALATSLHYDGQDQSASLALAQLLEREHGGPWAQAARELLQTLPKTTMPSSTKMPNPP